MSDELNEVEPTIDEAVKDLRDLAQRIADAIRSKKGVPERDYLAPNGIRYKYKYTYRRYKQDANNMSCVIYCNYKMAIPRKYSCIYWSPKYYRTESVSVRVPSSGTSTAENNIFGYEYVETTFISGYSGGANLNGPDQGGGGWEITTNIPIFDTSEEAEAYLKSPDDIVFPYELNTFSDVTEYLVKYYKDIWKSIITSDVDEAKRLMTQNLQQNATNNGAASPYKIFIADQVNAYLYIIVLNKSDDIYFEQTGSESAYIKSSTRSSANVYTIGYGSKTYNNTDNVSFPFNLGTSYNLLATTVEMPYSPPPVAINAQNFATEIRNL
jgi:hypothetical protein